MPARLRLPGATAVMAVPAMGAAAGICHRDLILKPKPKEGDITE